MQLAAILATKGSHVMTIHPSAKVGGLIEELSAHGIGAMVVSEDGATIAGIVSERDVVRALVRGNSALELPVASIMTTEVTCATPDNSVDELAALMTERRIRHVPITDEHGMLTGLVSIGDVVKSRLGELEGEREALLDYITKGG